MTNPYPTAKSVKFLSSVFCNSWIWVLDSKLAKWPLVTGNCSFRTVKIFCAWGVAKFFFMWTWMPQAPNTLTIKSQGRMESCVIFQWLDYRDVYPCDTRFDAFKMFPTKANQRCFFWCRLKCLQPIKLKSHWINNSVALKTGIEGKEGAG